MSKNKYKYQDIAEYLEKNGQKEAAEQLRAGFAERERGVCQKTVDFLKEKWKPLNTYMKIGLTLLFYAATVIFCEYWYINGFFAALKGVVDAIGIIALIGGFILTVGGIVIYLDK